MASYLLVILSLCLGCHGIDARKAIPKKTSSANEVKFTDDGSFECVDIYKQAAFDHPLLKNHKLQMKPSFSIEEISRTNVEAMTEAGMEYAEFDPQIKPCPQGTVPVDTTSTKFTNNQSIQPQQYKENPSQHHAFFYNVGVSSYYGASAAMSLENPLVEDGQQSTSLVWVQRGVDPDVEGIEAGWTVNPKLYGDNRTRVTGRWTTDSYLSTGCFDRLCPGFVQTHDRFTLGAPIAPYSEYHGKQYVMTVLITMDPNTSNWWLTVQGQVYGYWPKELFRDLTTVGAEEIRFGGKTVASDSGVYPPMGKGHFPSKVFSETSYFFLLKVMMGSDNQKIPITESEFIRSVDNTCYRVSELENPPNLGPGFTYGGPGGNDCGF